MTPSLFGRETLIAYDTAKRSTILGNELQNVYPGRSTEREDQLSVKAIVMIEIKKTHSLVSTMPLNWTQAQL